jgi:hypothetical protein
VGEREAERVLVEEETRRKQEREVEKARVAEEKRKKQEQARQKADNAKRDHELSITRRKEAEAEHELAKAQLDGIQEDYRQAEKQLREAEEAVREVERMLKERQESWAKAKSRTDQMNQAVTEAQLQEGLSSVRVALARGEEAKLQSEKEAAEKIEEGVLAETEEIDEEAIRQQELAESIRKMREMRELEEEDLRKRQEKQEQEREEAERRKQEAEERAREECERKAREEKARVEREQREREQEAAGRQKLYEEATAKERERCMKRDAMHRTNFPMWTTHGRVQRFEAVSQEFDEIKFSETQPLTFESVPWPLPFLPSMATFDDVEWSAVEEFFAAAKSVVGEAAYKLLVEKAHRRFHPDKWRSRGILNTVVDVDLRVRLENAGNVVAQAITPLWLATKAR